MHPLLPYARTVSWAGPPAFVAGVVLGLPAVAGLSLLLLAASAAACPAETRLAFAEGVRGLFVAALLASVAAGLALGLFLFFVGVATSVAWMALAGYVAALAGVAAARVTVRAFLVPKPAPPPPALPSSKPITPATHVELVAPPPPPLPEVAKKKVRELVLWAGMRRPAAELDQGNYMITGPPGRAKSTLLRHFLKPIIQEVLDPDSDSVLICFDPKRENYHWIASQMPKERDSLVPLWLFCPSDQRTCTLDFFYDFFSPANQETFALSMAPENPQLTQQFFENAFRTVVAEVIGAIVRKMGHWDLRLLMNVLSDPAYLKQIIGNDKYSSFVKELLSPKSEETAQNVVMELASKLAKWRKVAAHLGHVKKDRTFSIERFLSKRGILVIQKDDDYRDQHNAMNAMLLQRIGQVLMKMQKDPTGKRKVYIVVDEFPSLGYMRGFVDMLRELRSRGVVFVLIWQSWANMEHIWKEEAYSIQGALQSFMIVGSADPKDAEHAAKLVGKVRGIEEERGKSTSDGTSENETQGTSDSEGWTISKTYTRSSSPGGHSEADSAGTSGGTSRSYSMARGVSHQESESVTWRYFDRDIKSPTEIMRTPWPTKEGGFHGIGYCAGAPDACDFVYESDFIVREGVFEKNDHIPEYMEWPSEKFQLLEGLTRGELERLGLEDLTPTSPTGPEPADEGPKPAAEATRRPPPAVHDEDLFDGEDLVDADADLGGEFWEGHKPDDDPEGDSA